MSTRHLLLLFALLLATACPAALEDQKPSEKPGSMRRPITNGKADTAPAHNAVVVLDIGGGLCTGTLIAPRVVLTAAHCLEDLRAIDVRVGFGSSQADPLTHWVQAASVLPHPDYDSRRITNDVGLVRLRDPAPVGVTPIPVLPSSLKITSADVGASVEFSGFGETERGSYGVKLAVSDTIDLVCTEASGCSFRGNSASPNTICYDQQPGGPCSGDSGGPAFILRDGKEYVAGVTSYGDQFCRYFGCSTKADAFETFINDFIAERRAVLGAACTTGDDCENGFCADGVCCDSACDEGPCDTCLASAGAMQDGYCSPVDSATTCDDGNACTTGDRCLNGTCAGTSGVTCPASANPCLFDGVCDPATGQCGAPLPRQNGTVCSDGDGCTRNDRCSDGVCVGFDPVVCAGAGQCTETPTCDKATGTCQVPLKPEGSACDDGDPCTGGDACKGTQCGGAPVVCTPPNACHTVAGCDRAAGGCVFARVADGTDCGDGTCEAGKCVGASGCGCSAGAGEAPAAFALLALVGLLRRRR